MTDSSTLADRTYSAAVMQWESSGVRGPRPVRAAFDHLNAVADQVPDFSAPASAVTGSDATPEPLDAPTAAAVRAVLAEMRADQPRGASRSTPDDRP